MTMGKLLLLAYLSLLPLLVRGQACIGELVDIRRAEAQVTDQTVRRIYTLCPDTVFTTGVIENGFVVNGDDPISLRPNLTIQCGESPASRDNTCIIEGGLGLVGSPTNLPDGMGTVNIVGVTFSGLTAGVLNVQGTGNLQFQDCVFRNSQAVPNMVLNTDGSADNELDITFQDCLFAENSAGVGVGSNYTMMSLPSPLSSATFERCEFRDNDFASFVAFQFAQSLIYSAGPLTFIDTCFIDNQVRNLGQVIVVGDNEPTITNTAGTAGDALDDTQCDFIAYLPDLDPGQLANNPECRDFDGTVAASCSSTDTPNMTPVMPPTMIPTRAPAPSPCINDLQDILIAEFNIVDTEARRQYVLCPNTVFDTTMAPDDTASQSLVIRRNMTVICGESGSRDNNCIITGEVGLAGTPNTFDDPADVGFVSIQGITFSQLTENAFFMGQYNGVMMVKDCAFLDSSAVPNIYVESSRATRRQLLEETTATELDAARNLQGSPNRLDITFEDCLFADNLVSSEAGVNFAMVFLASDTTKTTFRGCTFRDNNWANEVVSTLTQTIIYNNGGELVMENNCFIDNEVLFFGVVNQLGENNPIASTNNFGTESTNTDCSFASVFDVPAGGTLFNPTCVDFDSTVCLAADGGTLSPTPPTPLPVAPPTSPPGMPPSPTTPPFVPPTPLPTPSPPTTPPFVPPTFLPTPSPTVPPGTPTPPPFVPPTFLPTPSPMMPVTAPPTIAPAGDCTDFNEECEENNECCTNYCFKTISQNNPGSCRSRDTSMSSMSSISDNRGGAGGRSM